MNVERVVNASKQLPFRRRYNWIDCVIAFIAFYFDKLLRVPFGPPPPVLFSFFFVLEQLPSGYFDRLLRVPFSFGPPPPAPPPPAPPTRFREVDSMAAFTRS